MKTPIAFRPDRDFTCCVYEVQAWLTEAKKFGDGRSGFIGSKLVRELEKAWVIQQPLNEGGYIEHHQGFVCRIA